MWEQRDRKGENSGGLRLTGYGCWKTLQIDWLFGQNHSSTGKPLFSASGRVLPKNARFILSDNYEP